MEWEDVVTGAIGIGITLGVMGKVVKDFGNIKPKEESSPGKKNKPDWWL